MAFQRERRLTVRVAADRLGIAERTLRDWIRERIVRAVRVNPTRKRSPWLVPESELDRIERERLAG